MKWEFLITPETTNEEIEKVPTTKLLRAVIKAEKQLGIKIQTGVVSIGPREQARQARDALLNKKQKDKNSGSMIRGSKHLTRNVALDVDTTKVQSPGLKVMEEEQNLADTGLLEFTFQVEFKLKSNDTEIGMFQEFVRRVTNGKKY